MSFLKWVLERPRLPFWDLLFWVACSGRGQLSQHEALQVHLEAGVSRAMCLKLKEDPPESSFEMTTALANSSITALWEILNQNIC